MASRILGMGDVLTLIEKAENDLDEKNARIMMEKTRKIKFVLMIVAQFKQVKKMVH